MSPDSSLTLPANPLLASLKLLQWLLLTPSFWRRYIQQHLPHVSPDFALADVQRPQWWQPAIRRVLWLAHGIVPLWGVLMAAVVLRLLGTQGLDAALALCYAFIFSVIGGVLGSLLISVAFGTVVSLLGGLLLSIPVGMEGDIVFSMAKNIAIAVVLSISGIVADPQPVAPEALLTILSVIFIAGTAGSVMHATANTGARHSQHRQLGSVVIGVFISAIAAFLFGFLTTMLARTAADLTESGILFSLVYDGLIGVVFASSFALIWGWYTWRWSEGLLLGIASGLLLGGFTLLVNVFANGDTLLSVVLLGLHGGIENALLYVLLFAFPYVLAKRIANPLAGIIAGIFGSAGVYVVFMVLLERYQLSFILPLTLVAFGLGMTFNWWRPLLFYPLLSAWNLLLYRSEERRAPDRASRLFKHSAFWDEHQPLPLFGLESFLVLVAERDAELGNYAIEYLTSSRQSWAAQEAQIEIDARRLQRCDTAEAIGQSYRQLAAGELSGPASALLRSFSRASRDVEAALAQESSYNQRLALDAVEERLDGLLRELTRSSEPYALRFRPIAAHWRQTLADYVRYLSEAMESRQELNNPYVIGIPLTEHQEIFVGRSDVSEKIERLLLDRRCPPLLLYGQRRTGKTSLLNNLGKLLPSTIVPLFVDFQGPASLARDYEGFLYNIARAMNTSAKRHRDLKLPPLTRESLNADPFTRFDEWLDEVEDSLDLEQMLLLAFDEFSALEHVLAQGRLDEVAVLGMFRHLIQHRPRFKILLAGSHTLDEFERWASYLINVQTVHLSYLQANEALQLIEQPVKDFPLRYEYEASQRIMEITRCHPALIQLICAEMVTLKNRQHVSERRQAHLSDVEAAIPGALQHGRFFFADIANNQVSEAGVVLLKYMATAGEGKVTSEDKLREQCPAEAAFETTIENLLHRELIEPLGSGYRFQVELIRRWFV